MNKKWLILFVEDNLSNGYYTYKVICLDSEINITNEYGDTQFVVPVKFVNSTSQLVTDYFKFGTNDYREPNKSGIFITRDFDFLKKVLNRYKLQKVRKREKKRDIKSKYKETREK